jgi:hypothetical protein
VASGAYTFTNVTENHTIAVTFVLDSGIDDVIHNKINIYPNPTNDDIFIKSEFQITKVEIYSLLGALTLLENNFNEKISVSALSKGIYMLKIYTDNDIFIQKIIKE